MDKLGTSEPFRLTLPPLTCPFAGSPNGVRTRASTLRGWCPRPLDDGAERCPSVDQGDRGLVRRMWARLGGLVGAKDGPVGWRDRWK